MLKVLTTLRNIINLSMDHQKLEILKIYIYIYIYLSLKILNNIRNINLSPILVLVNPFFCNIDEVNYLSPMPVNPLFSSLI